MSVRKLAAYPQTEDMTNVSLCTLLLALVATTTIHATQANNDDTWREGESEDEEGEIVNLVDALKSMDMSKLKDVNVYAKTLPALMTSAKNGQPIGVTMDRSVPPTYSSADEELVDGKPPCVNCKCTAIGNKAPQRYRRRCK